MAGSLFDRLTCGESGARMDDDESIRHHILRMFTARQGSVQALPEYGLPDINDLTLSRADLISETAEAIKRCIEAYEPRLTMVDVRYYALPESTFTLGFQISAMKYDADGQLSPWQWDISLNRETVQGRP